MEPFTKGNHEPFYRDEHLFVDPGQRLAMVDNQVLILTRKEYSLLVLLVQHAGRVVPRAILLTHVWGYVAKTRTRTLDVHIGGLRKKLRREGRRIQTIFGKGYSFCLSQGGPPAPASSGGMAQIITRCAEREGKST